MAGGALSKLTGAAFLAIQVAYARGARPGPAMSAGAGGSPIADAVAKGLAKVFGTGNDLMGHARMQIRDEEGLGNWWMSETKGYTFLGENGQKAPVTYHFATVHRRGGAGCTVYFAYRPGAEPARDTAASPPPASPPPASPPQPRRFVPSSGPLDFGGAEYYCEIEGRSYHLKDGSVIAYAPGGSCSRPGRAWGARDRQCHFELDFYEQGGGTCCVGDLGRVTRGDAGGPHAGQCWTCSGADCIR